LVIARKVTSLTFYHITFKLTGSAHRLW